MGGFRRKNQFGQRYAVYWATRFLEACGMWAARVRQPGKGTAPQDGAFRNMPSSALKCEGWM